MNRRSFFGFFPAAIVCVAVGAGHAAAASPRGFFKGRVLTVGEREEFKRTFIDPILGKMKVAGRDWSGTPNMWHGSDGQLLDCTVSRRTISTEEICRLMSAHNPRWMS